MEVWIAVILYFLLTCYHFKETFEEPYYVRTEGDVRLLETTQTNLRPDILGRLMALQNIKIALHPQLTATQVVDTVLESDGNFVRWKTSPDTLDTVSERIMGNLPYIMENVDLIFKETTEVVRIESIKIDTTDGINVSILVAPHSSLRYVEDKIDPFNLRERNGPLKYRNPYLLSHPFPTTLTENHMTEDMVYRVQKDKGLI